MDTRIFLKQIYNTYIKRGDETCFLRVCIENIFFYLHSKKKTGNFRAKLNCRNNKMKKKLGRVV